MIWRKESSVEEMNFFEVEFLDVTMVFDDKIREIVNTKIKNLRD
jgi:hypothetical protein